MDAYDSVINNNLNMYMKRLSILNIIMMVPTFITSFYGMNVELPFARYGQISSVIISGLCIISVLITNLLLALWEKRYPKADKKRESSFIKRTNKEKKNARRLKSIEAALQE